MVMLNWPIIIQFSNGVWHFYINWLLCFIFFYDRCWYSQNINNVEENLMIFILFELRSFLVHFCTGFIFLINTCSKAFWCSSLCVCKFKIFTSLHRSHCSFAFCKCWYMHHFVDNIIVGQSTQKAQLFNKVTQI